MISRGLAVLALIQAWEFLRLWRSISNDGVWRWPELQSSGLFPSTLSIFLSSRAFVILNLIRIPVSIFVFNTPNPIALTALLVMHVLTLLRWLGTFNGGSDYMNLLLLWATTLGFLSDHLGKIAIWYMALNLCLSYFKAGFYKVRNHHWRNGNALSEFLGSPMYARSSLVDLSGRRPLLNRFGSWFVIAFELSFPIALIHTHLAMGYLIMGLGFHLLNAYFFGLNRFLFAWLSAYPALLHCASR